MRLESLITWIVPLVVAAAVSGNLDTVQRWIWIAQSEVLLQARTANWGSPRYFKDSESQSRNPENRPVKK